MRGVRIVIPAALVAGAEAAASRRDVALSEWVAVAIEERLKRDAGRALLDEWAVETGSESGHEPAGG